MHRKQRLPWYSGMNHLLAVVKYDDRCLHIYKIDQMPTLPIDTRSALLAMSTSCFCLTILQEYLEWPLSEAAMSGYTLTDISESLSVHSLADEISRRWRIKPIPGWNLVHRGHLGVVFLLGIVDKDGRPCSVELNHLGASLYRGPISENEALQDHRKIRQWGLHDLTVETLRQVMDTPHLVAVRQLMRQLRLWIFEFALKSEMPF